MAWVYLDDQFPDHPKVAMAGGQAAWLFVCGLAYCRRLGTRGLIPKPQVSRLTDLDAPSELSGRLIEVGLWEDAGDSFAVHDYDDWNRASESRSEAGRKAAKARWDAERNADASPTHSNGNADPHADSCTIPVPSPTTSSLSSSNVSGSGAPPDDGPVDIPKETWDTYADRKLAVTKDVDNPVSWKKKVAKNAAREPEKVKCARDLLAQFDVSPAELGLAVLCKERGEPLPMLSRREVS